MTARLLVWALALLLTAGSTMLGAPVQALAAPANDDIVNATRITTLPFADHVDTTSATPAVDDPTFCSTPANNTVWYSLTPSHDAVITIDTFDSDYDTVLALYTGSRGSLQLLRCSDDTATNSQSQISFRAAAGTTYSIEVDSCCGEAGMPSLHVAEAPPPPNDDFANATPIPAVPFVDTVDATGATGEAGEPLAPGCNLGPVAWSVWYTFTPTVSGSVTAQIGAPNVAAYTGSSLTALTAVACASIGGPMTFFATAGTTYHLQAGDHFGVGFPLTFRLDTAPAVHASFGFVPSDPSTLDAVRFIASSTDPGGASFRSWSWTFGDGATAEGSAPLHEYAVDGDYTVGMTVTTTDGRSASATRTIHVATHDVAITAFRVPSTARAGQTRVITVGILDTRYPETVRVDLMRGFGGGFVTVASLTLPVHAGDRTTPFDFSYTFTDVDAANGRVTFKAVATIVDARDALPIDNTVIAPITTVTGRSTGTV